MSFTSIMCPYCGNEHYPEEASDHEQGRQEYECGRCDKTFSLDIDISFSWQSTRLEDKEL